MVRKSLRRKEKGKQRAEESETPTVDSAEDMMANEIQPSGRVLRRIQANGQYVTPKKAPSKGTSGQTPRKLSTSSSTSSAKQSPRGNMTPKARAKHAKDIKPFADKIKAELDARARHIPFSKEELEDGDFGDCLKLLSQTKEYRRTDATVLRDALQEVRNNLRNRKHVAQSRVRRQNLLKELKEENEAIKARLEIVEAELRQANHQIGTLQAENAALRSRNQEPTTAHLYTGKGAVIAAGNHPNDDASAGEEDDNQFGDMEEDEPAEPIKQRDDEDNENILNNTVESETAMELPGGGPGEHADHGQTNNWLAVAGKQNGLHPSESQPSQSQQTACGASNSQCLPPLSQNTRKALEDFDFLASQQSQQSLSGLKRDIFGSQSSQI
eukprot:Clim_evm16s209 gene=Clim_evmTU16s209